MGIWTKLLGGAEGCREAMRESYEKHVRKAKQERIKESPPHEAGLHGALATRYLARGTPAKEILLWGELAPFLAMKEAEAVEALAEYIVFQERPKEARVAWLKEAINSALCSCSANSRIALAAGGLINQVAWGALLKPETRGAIEDAIEKLGGPKEKKTITAEQAGIAAVSATLRGAELLSQKFEKAGLTAQLSVAQQARLNLELLLFELVCKALSLARFYGEVGYKAASVLGRETITTFAENLQVENASSFTEAVLLQLDSHYQYYAQDIWALWSTDNKEDFRKKSGVAGMGGVGEKILRKILHPVLGISLEEPRIDLETPKDFLNFEELDEKAKDAYKEWKQVPDMISLTMACLNHAISSPAVIKSLAEEFTVN